MYLKALSHIYIGLAHHDSSGTGHWPKGNTEGPLLIVTRGLLLDALRSAFRCSPSTGATWCRRQTPAQIRCPHILPRVLAAQLELAPSSSSRSVPADSALRFSFVLTDPGHGK